MSSDPQPELSLSVPKKSTESEKEKLERIQFEYNEKIFFKNLKCLSDTLNKGKLND